MSFCKNNILQYLIKIIILIKTSKIIIKINSLVVLYMLIIIKFCIIYKILHINYKILLITYYSISKQLLFHTEKNYNIHFNEKTKLNV